MFPGMPKPEPATEMPGVRITLELDASEIPRPWHSRRLDALAARQDGDDSGHNIQGTAMMFADTAAFLARVRDYLDGLIDRPTHTNKVLSNGVLVRTARPRVPTAYGLACHLFVSITCLHNQTNRNDGIGRVTGWVLQHILGDRIAGAVTGDDAAPNVLVREFGLSDKQDVNVQPGPTALPLPDPETNANLPHPLEDPRNIALGHYHRYSREQIEQGVPLTQHPHAIYPPLEDATVIEGGVA